jgi:hypothetical protein
MARMNITKLGVDALLKLRDDIEAALLRRRFLLDIRSLLFRDSSSEQLILGSVSLGSRNRARTQAS